MKGSTLTIVVVATIGGTGCSLLQRHPHSGYSQSHSYERDSIQEFYQSKDAYEESEVRQELGFSPTYILNEHEREQLDERLALKRHEQRPQTQQEKRQYYQYKPWIETDRERMEFLNLPSMEARERWAQDRGIGQGDEEYSEELAEIIENNDVALGMSQKAVMESWGDPDVIEVAGDPVYGNERWKYAKFVSSSDGYRKEIRFVYFESGRVVGWESF